MSWNQFKDLGRRERSLQSRIQFYLGKLVRGMKIRDLVWLLRFDELLSHVYLIDPEPPSVRIHPSRGSLPWPVILTLGSYSKKHIFEPAELRRRAVEDNIIDFKNRLRRLVSSKYYHGKEGWSKPLVPRRVRTCNAVVPRAVEDFGKTVGNTITSATLMIRAKFVCSRSSSCSLDAGCGKTSSRRRLRTRMVCSLSRA